VGYSLLILLNFARILCGNLDFSALSGQCVLALLVIHRRSEKFATFSKQGPSLFAQRTLSSLFAQRTLLSHHGCGGLT